MTDLGHRINYGEITQVDLPIRKIGAYKVSKFTVSKDTIQFRSHVRPGTYTKLTRNDCVVMSDTWDEMRDHYVVINVLKNPKGLVNQQPRRMEEKTVLVNGLGIGMILQAVMNLGVKHVTVVEKSAEVIELVGSVYKERYGDRLTIIHADALEYKPPKGSRYDVVWHDIWENICTDNLPEMTRLKRKYGGKCRWQGCWKESYLRRLNSSKGYRW